MSGRGPGGTAGGPPSRPEQFGPTLRRLLSRLTSEPRLVLGVVGLAVVGVGLSVVGPRLLGHATDIVFDGYLASRLPAGTSLAEAVAGLRESGQPRVAEMVASAGVRPGQGIDFGALGAVLALVLVVYVSSSALMWLQGRTTTLVVQRTVAGLRTDCERKLARLPLSYLDKRSHGDILSRVTNDVDNVAQSLQQTMSQLLTSLLTVVGVLVMMVLISPLLALVALVTVPVAGILTAVIAKRSQPHFVQQWKATGELNGHVEETFTGHDLVTVFGRRAESAERFARHNDDLYDSAFRAQFVSGIIQPTMMFVSNLAYVVVAVVGALRVGSGAITVGEVQAFVQYSRQFSQPLTQLASMVNLLQSGVASAERVFAFLDSEEEVPDPVDAVRPDRVRGRVEFRDVSFSYDPDEPLIEHLDLVVEPGQTVAIVGPTGAGKTTLTNLVLRFYDVDAGSITLDGVDVQAMDRDALRATFGVVLQDTWLFGGTIGENIAYGAESATHEQVCAAAEAASVDHLVRTLPDGYDTIVDEEGGVLSAGQRQLLTIARAFLADPAVLVLDEATSSVDTRTEALVQEAMGRLRRGRTSFVVAHRLSTIRDADVIVVMEDGHIVEQGTHDDLLAAGGAYQRLYAAQFSGALV
ncbi:MAG: ABC transporter ATP-binding protein [Nocardioidaceae bacterium]|nr:ABC transporter ATP-binding protein [Nocardioidaceae bacterium]